MDLELLISPDVPVLSPEDTGDKALGIMEDNNLDQLPLVANEEYLGLIQEHDLQESAVPEAAIGKEIHPYRPAIGELSHPFEAMRIINEMNLSVLPVVDNEHKYVGAITKASLLKYITEHSSINTPGGIIVLEILPRNYTLYDIARICENEDTIVLNVQVSATETGMLQVTLKLNRTVLSAVVSSFERHNYVVKAVYGEETDNEDITGKYNLLMNYINM